jgi:hypothetical protein
MERDSRRDGGTFRMGGRSSAHPSRPQISDPVRLDRGLGLLLPLWAVVQNRVPGWRAEVRLNGILPRAFAEAMLPKAQAPSRVGLGLPLVLGKFGRRPHRLGLLASVPKQNLMKTALLAECNVKRSNFRGPERPARTAWASSARRRAIRDSARTYPSITPACRST